MTPVRRSGSSISVNSSSNPSPRFTPTAKNWCKNIKLLYFFYGVLAGALLTHQWNFATDSLGHHHVSHSGLANTMHLSQFSYSHHNPHDQYCPDATCHTTELCQPCQRRWLIVISMGRTASTTLTWMLDSLPGIRMSGENFGALAQVRQMQQNTFFHSGITNAKHVGGRCAWCHNPIPEQQASCVAQYILESLNPPLLSTNEETILDPHDAATAIVGFKDVHFWSGLETDNLQQEEQRAQWLMEQFPCAKVIATINSDVDHMVETYREKNGFKQLYQFLTDHELRHNITQQNKRMHRLVDWLGPSRAILLDKNEWVNNLTKLNEMVSWLGFRKECHFTELLEFNTQHEFHTNNAEMASGYRHGKTYLQNMNPKCKRL